MLPCSENRGRKKLKNRKSKEYKMMITDVTWIQICKLIPISLPRKTLQLTSLTSTNL